MAINGFRADGEVYRYNASALEGDVAIPDGSVTLDSLASGVIDDTLAVDGAAADAKATGDAISSLNDSYANITRRTDGTVTLPSGYTYTGDHSSILSKINGVVMASISVQPPSSTLPSGWQLILTLPTGYRPIASISIPVAIYGSGNAYTTSLRTTVGTDGKVYVFTGAQMTSVVRIQFNVTYPAG